MEFAFVALLVSTLFLLESAIILHYIIIIIIIIKRRLIIDSFVAGCECTSRVQPLGAVCELAAAGAVWAPEPLDGAPTAARRRRDSPPAAGGRQNHHLQRTLNNCRCRPGKMRIKIL